MSDSIGLKIGKFEFEHKGDSFHCGPLKLNAEVRLIELHPLDGPEHVLVWVLSWEGKTIQYNQSIQNLNVEGAFLKIKTELEKRVQESNDLISKTIGLISERA